MALVITGAGGVLGRTLIKRNKGRDIVAVSNQDIEGDTNVKVFRRDAFFESFRFSDKDQLINCAFPMNNPDAYRLAEGLNYIGRVIAKAADEKAGCVINISSQSIYSQKRCTAANEQSDIKPETPYALGKYVSEIIINNLCRAIPHTNIRLASLIGPEYESRIVNRLIKKIVRGEPLTVSVCPRLFEFLDVRDAADAILKMADIDCNYLQEEYVLGGSAFYTLEQIVDIIQTVYKKYNPDGFRVEKVKGDDNANNCLDSRLIYTLLNWTPKFDLKESIETIIEKEWSIDHQSKMVENKL